MKGRAYHEAGHVVVSQVIGFPVEYTTIEEDVHPYFATKTTRLSDYFDIEALLYGELRRCDGGVPTDRDKDMLYSILLQRLGGYVAESKALMSGEIDESMYSDEDHEFALNVLNNIEEENAAKKYERMVGIVKRIIEKNWARVQYIAQRLLEERTIHFSKLDNNYPY
jgi:hypothetical protein